MNSITKLGGIRHKKESALRLSITALLIVCFIINPAFAEANQIIVNLP